MANKVVNYKKIRTILVYGKKKCIYMKPKGTREYVKSKGEFVLLSVYAKRVAKIAAKKLVKNKNGKKKLRGREDKLPYGVKKYIVDNSIKNPFGLYEKNIVKDDNLSILKKKKGTNRGGSPERLKGTFMKLAGPWTGPWTRPWKNPQDLNATTINEPGFEYIMNTLGHIYKRKVGSEDWVKLGKNDIAMMNDFQIVNESGERVVMQQAYPNGNPNPKGSITTLNHATPVLKKIDVEARLGYNTGEGFQRRIGDNKKSVRIVKEKQAATASENLIKMQSILRNRQNLKNQIQNTILSNEEDLKKINEILRNKKEKM